MVHILILDYSTDRSETGLISRWLPEAATVSSVFVERRDSLQDTLFEKRFSHVIHTGSALSITEDAPFTDRVKKLITFFRDGGIPQMGICYGHQLLCLVLIGPQAVRRSPQGLEAGWEQVSFSGSKIQIPGVRAKEWVWQSHFDEVISLPEGSHIVATNHHTPIQAFSNTDQLLFGTQFHPEFDRKTGNRQFLKERELLEKHGYAVAEMIKGRPSLDTGRIFFDFFLTTFQSRSTASG